LRPGRPQCLLIAMFWQSIFDRATVQRALRWIVRIGVIFGFVYLVLTGIDALMAKLALFESDAAARAMTGLLVTVVIGYALLLAIPFVPGVEIGLVILVLKGAEAAPIVYAATVLGLLLAFAVGHYAPLRALISYSQELSLRRLADMLARIEKTPRSDRLDGMRDRLPEWLAPILCNYRYLTLAALLNVPGNIVLGGGGGIMMFGGLSRLFQFRWVALTVMLATLPVPLAVWLLGVDILR